MNAFEQPSYSQTQVFARDELVDPALEIDCMLPTESDLTKGRPSSLPSLPTSQKFEWSSNFSIESRYRVVGPVSSLTPDD